MSLKFKLNLVLSVKLIIKKIIYLLFYFFIKDVFNYFLLLSFLQQK